MNRSVRLLIISYIVVFLIIFIITYALSSEKWLGMCLVDPFVETDTTTFFPAHYDCMNYIAGFPFQHRISQGIEILPLLGNMAVYALFTLILMVPIGKIFRKNK